MDLFHSLKETIRISQILTSSPLKTTQVNKITFRKLFSFTIFLSFLSVNIFSYILWFQEQNDVSFRFSGALVDIFTTIAYIAGVVISDLYFENIFNLFNKFVCPFKQYQNRLDAILRLKIIIRLLIGIILLTIAVIVYTAHRGINNWNIVSGCSFEIIQNSMYIIHVQFLTFVNILNRCFYLINNKLINLMKSTNILRNSTGEMMDSSDFCLQTRYCGRGNKICIINILSEIYGNLCMLTEQVNTTYSVHVLLKLLVIYCQLSFSLYWAFYVSFFYQQITTHQIMIALMNFFLHAIILLQLIMCCSSASFEVSLSSF
ncbi:hypothetical protein L9F63_001641, partial [Diploptera punctata]